MGLNGVAVTDHNTLAGAIRLVKAKHKGLIVIPGIEIETLQGHMLALNVTTPIPKKLSASETVERIHEAGGIAVACHPRVIFKMGWSPQTFSDVKIDAIEVVNSAAFPFFLSTRLSRRLAKRFSLSETAGSDSHLPQTIGMAYTLINADPKIEEIIQAIKEGATVACGKPIPWAMRCKKAFANVKRGCKTPQKCLKNNSNR
jgi:predicted metal-dependent phosphoesterase TrpH